MIARGGHGVLGVNPKVGVEVNAYLRVDIGWGAVGWLAFVEEGEPCRLIPSGGGRKPVEGKPWGQQVWGDLARTGRGAREGALPCREEDVGLTVSLGSILTTVL